MQWTYAEAISRVDIGLVLMIEYMAPFLIALYSWVLWRHRQQRAVWVSAFVALAGLALVLDVGGDAFARLSGPWLVFSVTTCLIFSYYATHASKLLRERPPQVVLGLGGLFAVVFWSLTLAPIWRYPVDVVGRRRAARREPRRHLRPASCWSWPVPWSARRSRSRCSWAVSAGSARRRARSC